MTAAKQDPSPSAPSTPPVRTATRPDSPATRRNAYYRLFGVALMVVAGGLLAVASIRDRVRGDRRPPAI